MTTSILQRLLLAATLLGSGPALAASNSADFPGDLPTEQDYFAPLPVITSASRLPQRPSTSPVAVTVIDRAMLEAAGVRDLEDVFRLVPGMIVGHENGHSAFVSYHGLADRYARRMQVLIDGRSVYTPAFGGVDWSALPLAIEDIERIEVVRGPDAATYGANAFLGTISIITRTPGATPDARAHLDAGNAGIYKVLGSLAAGSPELAWRLTASRWGDEGFKNLPTGREDNKDVTLATFRLDARPGADQTLSLQLGGSQEDARTGQEADDLFEPPHDENSTRQFLQARWQLTPAPEHELVFQLYHNRASTDEVFDTLPIPAYMNLTATLDRSIESQRTDVEVQHTWTLSPTWRLAWGGSGRIDQVRSPSYFSRPDWLENRLTRLFGQVEGHLSPRWLLNIGVMAENSSLTGKDISPRLAINFIPDAAHSFRVSAARAVRTPVLLEEMANQRFSLNWPPDLPPPPVPIYSQVFSASGGLDTETTTAYELGYLGRYARDTIRLDARLFQEKLQGLITYYNVPYPGDLVNGTTLDFRNNDEAILQGAEFQLRYAPLTRTFISANYAYVDIDSTDRDEIYTASGPRHNFSLLASQKFGNGYSASLGYYFWSRYEGLDTGDPLPNVRRLDLKLAKDLHLGTVPVEVSLTVQNALDEYQDLRDKNVFDTRVWLGLKMNY